MVTLRELFPQPRDTRGRWRKRTAAEFRALWAGAMEWWAYQPMVSRAELVEVNGNGPKG